MAQPKQTIIDKESELEGRIVSTCPVLVSGKVKGELTAPKLSVSATGQVSGKVKSDELRSEGELSGEFDADVVVLAGRVHDATVIRARSLEVKLNSEKSKLSVTFGNTELEVGGDPFAEDEPAEAKQAAPKSVAPKSAAPKSVEPT